jgi:hypothetical protein
MGDIADEHADRWYDEEPEDDDFFLNYVCIKHETKAAWLVQFEMTKDLESVEAWLPKSQCALQPDKLIQVPAWLVYEKDLESYSEDNG